MLRIGDIDVLVISDGVLPLPTAMLAHNIDPAVRATWLKEMFLPPDAYDWALNVVVRSGDRLVAPVGHRAAINQIYASAPQPAKTACPGPGRASRDLERAGDQAPYAVAMSGKTASILVFSVAALNGLTM